MAALIRDSKIPVDREEVRLEGVPGSLVGNFFLFLVAICHQTSPRGRPRLQGRVKGKLLGGWDYLIAKLEQYAQRDLAVLDPANWKQVRVSEIALLFADSEFGSLLTDIDGRARLIRDLGYVLAQHDWANVQDLFSIAGGRIASGAPHLIGLLSQFAAYRDPVFKKSLFFLALMKKLRPMGLCG